MKAIVIVGSLTLAIILGFLPSIDKNKPLYWKFVIFVFLTLAILVNLVPPITVEKSDASFLIRNNFSQDFPYLINTNNVKTEFDEVGKFIKINTGEDFNLIWNGTELPGEFKSAKQIIVNAAVDPVGKSLIIKSVLETDPLITFPYIPTLEERVRILNFHVPMAWIAVLSFLIAMVYSVLYLKKRDFRYDDHASSSAFLGLIFTTLATITGMIWAKQNWGSYWNWDPREVSIFILLLIYAAYFALRSSFENPEAKARLSSVYSILAFITVPFLVFILPRIQSGLHPGSGNSGDTGPIMSSGKGMLDGSLLIGFALSMFAFSLLFFWMLNLMMRYKKLSLKS
jgi:heme exporter protein C